MRVVGTGTVRAAKTGKRGFMHRYKITLRKEQVTKNESTCTENLTLIYICHEFLRTRHASRVTWLVSAAVPARCTGRTPIAARARYAARGARAR